MDSIRHDLRAALDEVGSATPELRDMSSHPKRGLSKLSKCHKCGSFPALGSKLRYCGRCKSNAYCGKACARAHWAEHKPECVSLRRGHNEVLAAYEARGGLKTDFRNNSVPQLGRLVS